MGRRNPMKHVQNVFGLHQKSTHNFVKHQHTLTSDHKTILKTKSDLNGLPTHLTSHYASIAKLCFHSILHNGFILWLSHSQPCYKAPLPWIPSLQHLRRWYDGYFSSPRSGISRPANSLLPGTANSWPRWIHRSKCLSAPTSGNFGRVQMWVGIPVDLDTGIRTKSNIQWNAECAICSFLNIDDWFFVSCECEHPWVLASPRSGYVFATCSNSVTRIVIRIACHHNQT